MKKNFLLSMARALFAATLGLLLTACGGGGGEGGGGAPPPAQGMNLPGEAIVKMRLAPERHVILVEQPARIGAADAPLRKLRFVRNGATQAVYSPPQGKPLLDFAVHPSGHVSAVLASGKQLELVRLGPTGTVLQVHPWADPQVRNDPRIDAGGVFDPESMVPLLTADGARLAPAGEDVVAVVRTGMNAVVAYGLRWTGAGVDSKWRTLVEPGMSLMGRFLTSGSHDVYDQLVSHVKVHVDTDAAGRVHVAVGGGPLSNLFEAHHEHFHEGNIDQAHGFIVTRLSGAGQRLGSTPVDSGKLIELHGLRATPTGVAVVGRVRTEARPDGTGWDAFAAMLGATGGPAVYAVVNVERGDVLFDIAPAADGQFIAVGASGYTQNPTGASISEEAAPLLVTLSATGALNKRHAFAQGPRHNQLRAVAAWGAQWLVGGSTNGPGTHSGDDNPALITADGLLMEVGLVNNGVFGVH